MGSPLQRQSILNLGPQRDEPRPWISWAQSGSQKREWGPVFIGVSTAAPNRRKASLIGRRGVRLPGPHVSSAPLAARPRASPSPLWTSGLTC